MTESAVVLGVPVTPPAFDVPRGACDCHVHVFGPADRFPYASDRLYTPPPASVQELLALQRALQFDRVVVVQPSTYGTDNACTLDAVRRLGARARAVAVIGPAASDAALREMHEAGVRGVRVNLATVGQRDPALARARLEETASRAAALGWHVQVYADLAVLAALHDAILALPAAVVVDHFGRARAAAGTAQPGFDALRSLVRSGKAYVKASAPYYLSDVPDYGDAASLLRALVEANPDRVVWATNWPHPRGGRRTAPPNAIEPFRPEDDGRALNRLREWIGDAALLRKILVDNPARLYGYAPDR